MTDKTKPPLLKDILGPDALIIIADAGAAVSGRFDRGAFSALHLTASPRSIMERVRHIAEALGAALPNRYGDALEIVRAMAPQLTHGFQAIAVTEFVASWAR
jgi:hypothetical protein